MKIVFTGASSFTGMWFCNALTALGHTVFPFLQRRIGDYEGLRKERANFLKTPIFDVPFGSEAFYHALNEIGTIDHFCHHAADVTNYKSPDFNPIKALENNTYNAQKTLEILAKKGCRDFILTGSVFEPSEGKGTCDKAVSPYGLSKGFTSEFYRYYVPLHEMKFRKFVIPNPFGPYEEVRFTTFLAQKWLKNEVPVVTQPDYVRDNIPVTLLAESYARFVDSDNEQLNPSYKPEKTEAFVARFSQSLKPFLNRDCRFEVQTQVDFKEPLERINTDTIKLPFDSDKFYRELADFYLRTYG